jgi:hypothetical protein
MADFEYSPDQREFYEPDTKFGNLSMIMGAGIRTRDPQEDQFIYLNGQNYRAFAASRLPWETCSEETINKFIDQLPALKVPKKQQEERRRMSEQARNAILDAAVRKVMAIGSRKLDNRIDYVLLLRGDDDETKARNDELEKLLKGTAEDRGRLLEERVRESMDLYHRILNGEVSNQELIDNFEEIHKVQDLVMNAQNFRPLAQPDKETGKIYYQISDEIMDILRDMERRANEISVFVTRIRQIANPNYEFLNLEIINEMPQDAIDTLSDRTAPEDEDFVFEDTFQIANEIKGYKNNILHDNLMRRFAEDFPEEVENAKLKFVGSDGEVKTAKCVYDSHDNTIQRYMEAGYAMVTAPSGKAACYQVDKKGQITRAKAADMLNNMTQDTNDMLKQMRDANKGLFIGSKEYSTSLKTMEKAFATVQKLGNPPAPEQMDQATAYYKAVLAEAEKYIEKKMSTPPTAEQQEILDKLENPDDRKLDMDDIRGAMSPRGKLRFDTMRQVVTFCKKQLSVLNLQSEAAEAELSFQNKAAEASGKAAQEYDDAVMLESDVGNIADHLRADIHNKLTLMLSEENFNSYDAQNTLSNMVLLEVIKCGRTRSNGQLVAGNMERQLAEKPEATVQAMRNYPEVKEVCEGLTLDKLRKFVMEDGARAVAKQILQNAMQNNPDAKVNGPQKQQADPERDTPEIEAPVLGGGRMG